MGTFSDIKLAAVVALATAFGAVAVPVITTWLPTADSTKETQVKLVEIAVSVLAGKRNEQQEVFDPDEQALRKWAVDVINRASSVQIVEPAKSALVQGTATFRIPTLDQIRLRSEDLTLSGAPWEHNSEKAAIPQEVIERLREAIIAPKIGD